MRSFFTATKRYLSVSSRCALLAPLLILSSQVKALEIYDVGAFMYSPTLGQNSLGYLDGVFNDFPDAGIGLTFDNSLDANGYGTLTWLFTNNTTNTLSDTWLFGFLDAEIDPDINSSYNEYGRVAQINGTGASDAAADSWEIDEPGFSTGDIFNNLVAGALDNSNGVPSGSENDVSLALGFFLGDIFAGESLRLTLQISAEDIGGLIHGDAHSLTEFYFNGLASIDRAQASVPEPSTFAMLLLGIGCLVFARSSTRSAPRL